MPALDFTWGGLDNADAINSALKRSSRRNRWAAFFAGTSAFLMAAALMWNL